MHRQIAGKLTGPVTKWFVLAAWIILFVLGGMLNAKLTDVQNNEAATWLPGSAESTEVVNELSKTVNPNDIPTLVVYYREGGLTDEDFAAIEAQAQEIAQELTGEHPRLVVWKMTKSLRGGKVFLDWSQNTGAKTTISPYSLRGRDRPYVATPRTWEEIEDGVEEGLGQLEMDDVLARVEEDGDIFGDLLGRS